jgi:predicted acylesterase/phospholipase RssA
MVPKTEEIPRPLYNKLVLSGGGAKGICYIGVLKKLEEMKCIITEVTGTSAGALFGLLILLGYTSKDLISIVKNFNFEKLVDLKVSGMIKDYGLDDGEKLVEFLKIFIKNKGFPEEITMKEFFDKTSKVFTCMGCCVNTREEICINYKTYPDIPLYLAVRISTSIPIIFKPVKFDGKLYVDGCLTCNFPVFDLTEENSKGVLCVLLQNVNDPFYSVNSIEEYMFNLVKCSFKRIQNQSLLHLSRIKCDVTVVNVTKEVYCPKMGDFSMTSNEKTGMIKIGYNFEKL